MSEAMRKLAERTQGSILALRSRLFTMNATVIDTWLLDIQRELEALLNAPDTARPSEQEMAAVLRGHYPFMSSTTGQVECTDHGYKTKCPKRADIEAWATHVAAVLAASGGGK